MPTGEKPPAWPIGLTPAQDAALDAAEAVAEPQHKPGTDNPFVTHSKLPAGVADRAKPPAWPIGLTPAQDAALDAAEAVAEPEHKPGTDNPFVTHSKLQQALPTGQKPPAWPIGLTPAQDAALDAAEAKGPPHPPSAENPFVTPEACCLADPDPARVAHRPHPGAGCRVDAAEAVAEPEHKPGANNPFVTQSMLQQAYADRGKTARVAHRSHPGAGCRARCRRNQGSAARAERREPLRHPKHAADSAQPTRPRLSGRSA